MTRIRHTIAFLLFATLLQPDVLAQITSDTSAISATSADWSTVPWVEIESKPIPTHWHSHSDDERTVRWDAPTAIRGFASLKNTKGIIHYSTAEGIGLTIARTHSQIHQNGNPRIFLDRMDASMMRTFAKKGRQSTSQPVVRVKHMNMIGRILRVNVVEGLTVLKCDLTTPTACYSLGAVGPTGKHLRDVFLTFVGSVRLIDQDADERAASDTAGDGSRAIAR